MSFFVVKNRIHLTRGDSAEFDLTIRDRVTGSEIGRASCRERV